MMRFTRYAAPLAAAALFAVPAVAQDTTTGSTPGAATGAPTTGAPTQDAPATATPPATAAAGPVTDAEVTQFASALTEVDKINKDTATPAAEKQTKMASAVTTAGLTPERFNTIATAMSSDSALQAKVAAKLQPAAAAPQQ
jgi:hypothetical protein